MRNVLSKTARLMGVPLGALFMFTCMSLASSLTIGKWTGSDVIATYVADGLFILIGGYFYRRLYLVDHKKGKMTFRDFSGIGWTVILVSFVLLYVLSQACGTVLNHYIQSDYMVTYTGMSDKDLLLYVILSVTLAPLAEEILFRGLMYQWMRKNMGIMFSVIMSSAFFAAIHGTVGHIPVTVGLTFFVCIMIELTGKLRYAIGFHILYNIFGLAYILPLHWTTGFTVCGFAVFMIFLTVGLAASPYLRKWLQKGYFPTLESVLDKKRKETVAQLTGTEQKLSEDAQKPSDEENT